MNNFEWLCENDREQLKDMLTQGQGLCEHCNSGDGIVCEGDCGGGIRRWLEAEHGDGNDAEVTQNGKKYNLADADDADMVPNREKYKLSDAEKPKVDACGRISAEDFAQAVRDGMEKINAAIESHRKTHDLYAFDELDTREKLQADMDDCFWLISKDEKSDVLGWLDRQKAIDERECEWWKSRTAELYERIMELEAELRECDEQRIEYLSQRDAAEAYRRGAETACDILRDRCAELSAELGAMKRYNRGHAEDTDRLAD